MTLFIGIGLHAQSTTSDKPADFAIVALINRGAHFECTVKYSDGKIFSLDKTLKMTDKDGKLLNQDDVDEQEFKILDYFQKMGYEFLSVVHDRILEDDIVLKVRYDTSRLYFKHKGL